VGIRSRFSSCRPINQSHKDMSPRIQPCSRRDVRHGRDLDVVRNSQFNQGGPHEIVLDFRRSGDLFVTRVLDPDEIIGPAPIQIDVDVFVRLLH